MAQHYTGFAEFPPGALPADFARLWGVFPGSDHPLPVFHLNARVEGATDARVLRMEANGVPFGEHVRWNTPGTALTTIEVVTRVRLETFGAFLMWPAAGVAARTSGTSRNVANGYYCSLEPYTQQLIIAKLENGAHSVPLGVAAFPIEVGVWYRMRFRLNMTTLQAKAWADDVAEPAGWMISIADATFASGGVGVYGMGTGHAIWDYLNVATAGETANLGGSPPALPNPVNVPILEGSQRLTLFQDDDETPISDGATQYGLIDTLGNVLEPTVSSHPAFPRGWLEPTDDLVESEANFRDGSSRIGSVSVVVLDKRRTAADQGTGWFTYIMAQNGENQINGRRALLEEQAADGTWRLIIDGTVHDCVLNDDLSSYTLYLRDIRERERKTRAFTRATSTSIYPPGIAGGWGTLPNGKKLVPDAGFASGYYRKVAGADPRAGRIEIDHQTFQPFRLTDSDRAALFKLGSPMPVYGDGGAFAGLRYTGLILDWRPYGSTGAWTTIVDMPYVYTGSPFDTNHAFSAPPGPPPAAGYGPGDVLHILGGTTFGFRWLALNADRSIDRPTEGQRIEFRVRSGAPPTADLPLFIERNRGEFLRAALEGDYSENIPRIRYDAARLDAIIAEQDTMLAVITEPADDLRKWLQDNWYKPEGYAPTLDERGRVSPVRSIIPAADQVLPELNDGNTEYAVWGHGAANVVNRVLFTYKRGYLEPDNPESPRTPFQRLRFRDVTIDRPHPSTGLFGEQKIEYRPISYIAVTDTSDGGAVSGDHTNESGARKALARSFDAIDRFYNGAPVITARCRLTDAAVAARRTGDWVILNLTWLPDYQTRRRGVNRIVQIMRLKKLDGDFVEFVLVDGGTNIQAMAAPTIAAPTLAASGDQIEVDVTGLAMVGSVLSEARLEFALVQIGSAAPAETSPLWQFLGRMDHTGIVRSGPLPGGFDAWVRSRGQSPGRRPSAWAVHASKVTIAAKARIRSITLRTNSAGQPVFTWDRLANAEGVRIEYTVHAAGTPPATLPLASSVDRDIDDLTYTIPVTLRQGEQITARIVPWTGWTGAAVSGAAGDPSQLFTIRREESAASTQGIHLKEIPSVAANVGTLQVDVDDPQGRVTLVEFQTQVGDQPASAWTPDSVLPYLATVTLIEKHVSRIGYRITGYRADGTIGVLIQNVVEFTVAQKPGVPVIVATYDAAGALTAVLTGDYTTATMKVVASKTGIPTPTDIRAASALAGRVVATGTLVTLNPGERAYVAAFAYAADGTESDRGYIAVDRPTASTGTGQNPPNAYIETVAATNGSEEVSYAGALGVGGVGPLDWRRAIDLPGAPGTFGAWASFPAANETVVRHDRQPKTIRLEVRDTGTGAITRALRVVDGKHAGTDWSTGRVRRQEPMDDGWWGLKSGTQEGTRATSDVEESGGKQLRRMFGKQLPGDPDDLDGIPNSLTYARPRRGVVNPTDGTIDFGNSDMVNRISGNLRRSVLNSTALEPIIERLTDTGHAAITMQESGGKELRRMFGKGLPADPDTIDSVPDSASFRRTSISYIDSNNRPYALQRPDGSQRLDADEIQKWFGRQPNSLVTNGGAQIGALGALASLHGWTYGAGNGMIITSDGSPPEGDRQWSIGNGDVNTDSYYYQDIACADGEIFHLSVQMRASFLTAGGNYARVYVIPISPVTFELYEKTSPSEVAAGTPSVGYNWVTSTLYPHRRMQSLFKTIGTGTFRIFAQLWGAGTAYFDAIEVVKVTPEHVKRLFGLSGTEGQLKGNVTQPTGGQTRNMMRGYQTGLCRDGVGVTFSPPYNTTPHLHFPHVPGFQGDSTKWSTPGSYSATKIQIPSAKGDPLSTTGFTPYLKIKQKTAGTERTVQFDVAPNSVTLDNPSQASVNVGAKAFGGNMPAQDNQYTVRYALQLRVDVIRSGGSGEVQATVRVFTSPDAGSSWNLRGTRTHGIIRNSFGASTRTDYDNFVINESGLDATDLVRLQLYAIYWYGDAGGDSWATLRGSDNNPTQEGNGITWYSGGTEIVASMTPDLDDYVRWEAWEEATA